MVMDTTPGMIPGIPVGDIMDGTVPGIHLGTALGIIPGTVPGIHRAGTVDVAMVVEDITEVIIPASTM